LADEAKQTQLNIFMAHGSQDDVPHSAGRSAFEVLSTHNMDVSWQEYPMGHPVCTQELQAVRQWLISRLS